MSQRIEKLMASVREVLADKVVSLTSRFDEVTLEVRPEEVVAVMTQLRDAGELKFDQLIDLCGMDYSTYGDGRWTGKRFAVVYHLLSVALNQRVRVRVLLSDDELPCVASVVDIWTSASWFEREAFDLFGIIFEGHPDLRRILTDYGFIGHPFRKDFPLSGNVEVRYDAERQRVIYQPVTVEPREITPRIVREENYGV